MARSRNIKPGFFTNDALGEMDPLCRLLFAGLWCHADREGRLPDRPKKLKAEILPYDNCDVNSFLQCLHSARMVLRYVADGIGYIQIVEFKKHQNPHVKEAASAIPAPDEHGANTGVVGLIPSSLIPDSGFPSNPVPANAGMSKPPAPPCPHVEIIALYHRILPMGRQVQVEVWKGTRADHMRARWREDSKRQRLEWWEKFFTYAAKSKFLTGQVPPAQGHKQFEVSLDWLCNPTNFAKVYEGAYHG